MLDYLVGRAMMAGHSPEAARDYAWRDLELLTIVSEAVGSRTPW